MVKEIANFILNLIGVGIFGGDNDFGGLFSQFFQDFINAFVKQIIGVRALLGILLTILDNGKDIFENLQRVMLSVRGVV